MLMAADIKHHKKVVAIIQARMGSERLPGKVLLPVNGKSVLERVVSRVERASSINLTVVATSDKAREMPIVDLCKKLGVVCFRGSENNVLQRFYLAAKQYEADVIVRITADCPLIDAAIIDEIVDIHFKNNNDYTANDAGLSYPRGMDVEVMNYASLAKAYGCATTVQEKEHVTCYIYNNLDLFKVVVISAPNHLAKSKLRLCVDEEKDLILVRRLYEYFAPAEYFSFGEILGFLEKHPEISRLNEDVKQKAI